MIDQRVDVGATAAKVSAPLDALRNATSDDHRKLEAAIDWIGAFQSYGSYRDLLQRFAGVVPPLEQAIARQLVNAPPPEFEPRVRTRWLESDLAVMAAMMMPSKPPMDDRAGDEAAPQAQTSQSAPSLSPPSSSSPTFSARDFEYIDNAAAAVGAQYVLEGSSLGGQFLSRQLFARLQLTPESGGAYFAAYGTATGGHWQAFRRWANLQLGDPRSTRLAVEAARLTFSRFGKALAGSTYE